MDDDAFEDLFSEADLLPGSSQESLTNAAANMSFDGHIEDEDATDFSFAPHDDTDMIDPWTEDPSQELEELACQEPK